MPIFAVDIGAKPIAAIAGKDEGEVQRLIAAEAVRNKWRAFGLIDDTSKPTVRNATDAESLRWNDGARPAVDAAAFDDMTEAEGDNHVVFLVPIAVPTDEDDEDNDHDE